MELSELGRRSFGAIDVALFSAATWNPHLIHLTATAADADGLPGVVVQSHLVPATMLDLLDEQRSLRGLRLSGVAWRNRSPVMLDAELVFEIEACSAPGGTMNWRATNQGVLAADGTVDLHPRRSA